MENIQLLHCNTVYSHQNQVTGPGSPVGYATVLSFGKSDFG